MSTETTIIKQIGKRSLENKNDTKPQRETDMLDQLRVSKKQDTKQQQQQCPICNIYLSIPITEFEVHVNKCLDKASLLTKQANKEQQQQTLLTKFGTIRLPLTDKKSSALQEKSTNITTTKTNKIFHKKERIIPDYKWMKDTNYVVDAFSYGSIPNCEGYFLTHFHSDHYHGLKKTWDHGPIYCSQITANLVMTQLGVAKEYIHVLPMDETVLLTSTIKISLIDANHCPGSVLFIFDIKDTTKGTDVWIRHLHTGDFRANPQMCLHPLLRQPENAIIDHLYLDTTYLNAKYSFPAQDESIQAACELIKEYIKENSTERPKTALEKWIFKQPPSDTTDNNTKSKIKLDGLLIVVGTYTIGKERVFYNIAKSLGSKIYVTSKKREILRCQNNKDIEELLTDNQTEAHVHVIPLNDIKAENMNAYLKSFTPRFNSLIAFKPTGWTFQSSKAQETNMEIGSLHQVTKPPLDRTLNLKPSHSSPSIKIYGIPYSEHSSFRELASFIGSLNIRHIIPTVNYEKEDVKYHMYQYLNRWQSDKKDKPIQIIPYPNIDYW
ncbi:DNA repair metallo-beta-lactamase-domain-containing protein [Cunninghamella echinulata]|nr:DNA repair metallo-beta-lactamase-domain-containing protein [Cunninghamella echinulata]